MNDDGLVVSGGGDGGASAGDGVVGAAVGLGLDVPLGLADDRILTWSAGVVDSCLAGGLAISLAVAVAVLSMLVAVYDDAGCTVDMDTTLDAMTEFGISVAIR